MTDQEENRLILIELDKLFPSPYQPRAKLNEQVVAGAALAIIQNGNAFPKSMAITVRPATVHHRQGFEIVSGHHRVEAAHVAKVGAAYAFVERLSDRDAAMRVAASNNHAVMSMVEHGKHARYLKDTFGVTAEQYAAPFGHDRQWAYGAMWAYETLERIGGLTGKYAGVSYRTLADLRQMSLSTMSVESAWETFLDIAIAEGYTTRICRDAITFIRNGEGNMRAAFERASGRAEEFSKEARKRRADSQVVPSHLPDQEAVRLSRKLVTDMNGSRAALDPAVKMDAHRARFNQSKSELRAQIDMYEQRFGHLITDREEFARACAERLESWRAEVKSD